MSIQKIWFPQIESSDPPDSPEFLIEALRKFYKYFGISTDGFNVSKNPLKATHNTDQETTPDLFNLSALIKSLKEKKTIWAFGTFSSLQMTEYSHQELGFNLFDLPGKIFSYIPIILSPGDSCFEQLLSFKIQEIGGDICSNTVELLQWSRCHKACLRIQDPFGHGSMHGHSQRDWLQTKSCLDIFNRLEKLKIDYEKEWADLPCGSECQLLKQINKILETLQGAQNKDKPCPGLARPIAFLDCRKYRVAQSKYFAELTKTKKEKNIEQISTKAKREGDFERIIILDDNLDFREQLRKDLCELKFIKNEDGIIEAHPQKSWENCCLCYADGKDIL